MNRILAALLLLLFASTTQAAHLHLEKEYQAAWCDQNNGIQEYRLNDLTRVDCLTDTHAIEFDFASKWAESVGQSLYYGLKTGKRPGVVLIIEKEADERYFLRLKTISDKYNIHIWKMNLTDLVEQ